MHYLLDTNILSELIKPRPNTAVTQRLLAAAPRSIWASEATRYELRYGAMLLAAPAPLWARIQALVLPIPRWMPVGAAISERAGNIAAQLRRQGRPSDVLDPIIAATALELRCPLVTRNVGDFEFIDELVVENWFAEN
jgi:predicted nucleic acid-binding protein